MSKRKLLDVQSVNPRYRGAKMSDVARPLMRPKDPKVLAALERLRRRKGRSVTGESSLDDAARRQSDLCLPKKDEVQANHRLEDRAKIATWLGDSLV